MEKKLTSVSKSTSTTSEMKDSSTVTKRLSPERKKRKLEPNRKNSFRAEGMNWLLTYPQCSVTKEDVLKNVLAKSSLKVLAVIVGQENHADGELHLHMIICLESKLRTRDAHYWDFITGKHGNYKVVNAPKKAYAYVTKEDPNPLIHGIIPKAFLTSPTSKSEIVAKMLLSGCTVRSVIEEMPGYSLANLTKLISFRSYITTVSNTDAKKYKELSIQYGGKDENTSRIVEWLNGNLFKQRKFKAKQLWISGPPNTMKTTLLMKLSEYTRIYPLPLGEDFYDSYDDDSFDLIVADEYKAHKPITFLNSFVQGGLVMNLRIKGGQIFKKKNLPVIICSNYNIEENYTKSGFVALDSINQRFDQIHLTDAIDMDNITFNEKTDKPEKVVTPEPVVISDPGKEEEVIEVTSEDEYPTFEANAYDPDEFNFLD